MKKLLLGILAVYQNIISPLLHQLLGVKSVCRSNPRCVVYAKDAITKYGAGKGTLLSLRRIINCQPYFTL